MKVAYMLYKVPNKAGEKPIRCSISMRGERYITTIGYCIPEEKWDKETKRVKQGARNAAGDDWRVINARMDEIRSHFNNYDLRTTEKPTVDDLKREFEKAINRNRVNIAGALNQQDEAVVEAAAKAAEVNEPEEEEKVTPAVVYFDQFIKEESSLKEWSMETYKMVKSFKNHLLKFNKKAGLDYFDRRGLERFLVYLRAKAKLEESSVEKQYKNLTWFLRWAIRQGYTQVRDAETYSPVFKKVQKPVIFLTKEELDKVYNYKVPKNGKVVKLKTYDGKKYEKTVMESGGIARARDLFCFCAFTSLRYSDVVEVRRIDIHDNTLNVTTQKTHDRLPIYLHENALAILDKYKNENFPGGKALPYMTNQQMNRCLKDLCELCGINTPYTITCYRNGNRYDEVYPKYELVGTHAGRRTFICFALSNGVPPDVVMKFTGHCDYKSMKPYIDITEDAKKDAIKKMESAWRNR
ncbi:MAG: site-specific integrase [Bacteroidales bacterium]|nr:site-specific integrase [Bacteroidales bacterium]